MNSIFLTYDGDFLESKITASEILVWFARYVSDFMYSVTCSLVLNIYVFSRPSLNKLQSRICGQFTFFKIIIIGEEEEEKMTKVHDYPKGGEDLYSCVLPCFWW